MTDQVEYLYNEEEGWYFWDEAWVSSYGPYKSEADARAALKNYIIWELG